MKIQMKHYWRVLVYQVELPLSATIFSMVKYYKTAFLAG